MYLPFCSVTIIADKFDCGQDKHHDYMPWHCSSIYYLFIYFRSSHALYIIVVIIMRRFVQSFCFHPSTKDEHWTLNIEQYIVFRRFFVFLSFSFSLNRCHWLSYTQPSNTKIKMFRLPAVDIGSGRWFNDCFWHPASYYYPAWYWILKICNCVYSF